jgi:hypothetical protein
MIIHLVVSWFYIYHPQQPLENLLSHKEFNFKNTKVKHPMSNHLNA